jgi:glycosyltransferase involved in cell wall biosynthesis
MISKDNLELKIDSKKPRILFVVTTPLTANVFLLSHFQVLSMHYSVFLCVNTNLHKLLPELEQYVEVIHVELLRKTSLFADFKALFNLFFVVRRVKPTVIHSVTPKAGLIGMLAGFLARVPFRWHTFTGQVWATRQFISKIFLKSIDKCIVFFSTNIFTDSYTQSKLLVKENIVSKDKISVLGFGSIAGVNIDRFQKNNEVRLSIREKLACKTEACVFLFVGRLVRDKGVFDLVHAFSIASKNVEGIELWMVGPDEENLQSQLEEMALLNNLSIRFLGASTAPEKYMMSADVFVLPSYREGFGSVIIEAAACCIPSIAYRIDGVVDAVEDGVTGELIDLRNVEALARSMISFAESPSKRIKMGKNSRERVMKYFRSEEITKAWLVQYKSVLN